MLSRKNIKPGDLKERKITVGGKDISAHVLNVVIVENLFEFTWSATLFINDTNNLLINAKIFPGEEVKIKIATSHNNSSTDGSKEFKFRISRISGREFKNENQQSYVVDCVDETYLINSTLKVYETFEDLPDTVIAQKMAEKVGIDVELEENEKRITHQFLGASPFSGVAQMMKSAEPGDYVFFQSDSDGKFTLKKLETLYKEGPVATLFMRPKGITGMEVSDSMFVFSKYTIRDSNVLLDNGLGVNGATLNQFDFINKMNIRYEIGDSPQSNIGFVPFHEGSTDKAETQNQSASTWFFDRKLFLSKIENNVLTVQLPGGAKEWEWIGKTVKVELPSQQTLNKNLLFDPDLKGKYLVSGVTHNIGNHDYVVNLELLKYELGE